LTRLLLLQLLTWQPRIRLPNMWQLRTRLRTTQSCTRQLRTWPL
jgi:hypothetical protein